MWISGPLDAIKQNISSLNVEIEGFTEDADNDGVSDALIRSNTPIGIPVDGAGKSLLTWMVFQITEMQIHFLTEELL